MKKNQLFAIPAIAAFISILLTGCNLQSINHAVTQTGNNSNTSSSSVNTEETGNADTTEISSEKDIEEKTGSNSNTSSQTDYSSLSDEELYEKLTEDYKSYLEGNIEAFVSYIGTDMLMFEESYTYKEMIDAVNKSLPDTWFKDTKIIEVNYAIIDCGNDNFPEMVINFDIHDGDLNNRLMEYYVLKYINGSLCIVDSYSSYERSHGDINYYGIFTSWGSSGANTYYDSYERCNAEAIHEFVLSCTTDSDLSEAVIPASNIPSDVKLPKKYPSDFDYNGDLLCHAFTFEQYDYDNDGDPAIYDNYLKQIVYVFENDDEEIVFPAKKYMEIYDKAGITVTDWDGLNAIIDKRLDELDLTREELGLTEEDTTYPFSGLATLTPFFWFYERFDN